MVDVEAMGGCVVDVVYVVFMYVVVGYLEEVLVMGAQGKVYILVR